MNRSSFREGLADRPEKRALVYLLRHILIKELRGFLESVDSASKRNEALDAETVAKEVDLQGQLARDGLERLLTEFPEIASAQGAIRQIRGATEQISRLIQQVRYQVDLLEDRADHLSYLAGQGQQTEVLIHELRRPIRRAIRVLEQLDLGELDEATAEVLRSLRLELVFIDKRLRTLDPGATSGRRRRAKFDLIKRVQLTALANRERFEARGVNCEVSTLPSTVGAYEVRAVEGMIIQILDNLIDNSLYWLHEAQNRLQDREPTICIVIDTEKDLLIFSDNGPGIPSKMRERVFEPYFSTKGANELKGLGLYISRLHAEYHKSSLRLEGPEDSDNLHTFVLDLSPLKC